MPARTDRAIKTDTMVFMTITPRRQTMRTTPLSPVIDEENYASGDVMPA